MNTYKTNPIRGLSRLQKDILAWLQEQKEGTGNTGFKPSFFCPIYASSFSRALGSLVKRGLVKKIGRTGGSGHRIIALSKQLTRRINSFHSQEIKEFKNLALTAADWAKRKGLGQEAVRHALSYALLAERKLGEKLGETERAKGTAGMGRPKLGGSPGALPKEEAPTLSSLGLTKRESSEAQILASIPETEFEKIKTGKKSKKAAINEARRKKKREEAKSQPSLPGKKK